MSDRIQPSDNAIATALVIAESIVTKWGKHRNSNNESAAEIAKEVNEVARALVHGWSVSGLHGAKS